MILVTKTSDQTRQRGMCVCVFCHPIYSGRRACGRTSRVTQEEDYTGFVYLPSAVLAFIFIARRIQPFLSLVDREVECCVLTT